MEQEPYESLEESENFVLEQLQLLGFIRATRTRDMPSPDYPEEIASYTEIEFTARGLNLRNELLAIHKAIASTNSTDDKQRQLAALRFLVFPPQKLS